jgi:tRNA U34 5-carboxymethylaminomethyl modifying GTPase MnmE/TrmE
MSQTKRDQLNYNGSGSTLSAGSTVPSTATIEQFKELRQQVQVVLEKLAQIAERLDISYEEAVEEGDEPMVEPLAEALRKRIRRLEQPFRLAIVGEFSRGKSSLINALLQHEILASDHRPNTAAQTTLKYGQPERFKVSYFPACQRPPEEHISDNLLKDLARFTSDAAVDSDTDEDVNEKYAEILSGKRESLADTIASVEVWLKSDFQQRMEVEIIDTPGLGAVFRTHEQVTLRSLDVADAIIFTIQIEPGVHGREIAFIRLIREHVPKIFFVVTKTDLVRNQREIPERVDYIRQTIEIKAKINVEYIFPISAQQALEGASEKSGFPALLPSLEQFLVQANGVSRMVGPLRFTDTQARHVLKLQKAYIQRLDSSQDELIRELEDLKANAKSIQRGKEDLLNLVEESIKDIREDVLKSINSLWSVIRRNVESEIASLNSNDLRNADAFIQAAIKDSVAGWIENRKSGFVSAIRNLNRKVKENLMSLLKTLEFDETQFLLIRSIEVDVEVPINTRQLTSDIGDRIMQTLLSVGVSTTIANVAGSLVRAASNFFKSVKRGILGFFGIGRSRSDDQPQDNSADVRQRLYQVLMNDLPGTNVNTYEAIVEGYVQNGRRVDGVRQVIRNTFTDWGNDLNQDISSLINNNLQTRLHSLQSQLDEQRGELRERTNKKVNAERMCSELDQIIQSVRGIETKLKKIGAE